MAITFGLAAGLPAHAALVPAQRGNPCGVVWDTGSAAAAPGRILDQPWRLVCADGDLTCDRDGVQNGACAIAIAACANVPLALACTRDLVTRITYNGVVRTRLIGFEEPLTSGRGHCGTPGTIILALRGKSRRSSHPALLIATAGAGKGQNRLRVQCVASPKDRGTTTITTTASTTTIPGAACGGIAGEDRTYEGPVPRKLMESQILLGGLQVA